MGGKGRKRREKNFLAAHGGDARLPPPPKLKELDTLPSKLRKLMVFKNKPPSQPLASLQTPEGNNKKKGDNIAAADKKANTKGARSSVPVDLGKGDAISKISDKHLEEKDASTSSNSNDKRKRKRNKKAVEDLRLQLLDQAAALSKRKERKKEYFESRKKKQKKENTDDIHDFPGREEIKFGEIVQAPPKLSFPKVRKAFMDASKERARLEAVEAYRNRRGWTSRLGIPLPALTETPSS